MATKKSTTAAPLKDVVDLQLDVLFDALAVLESLQRHLLDRDDTGRRLAALAAGRVASAVDAISRA